jgi:hypothetical protein
LIIDEPLGKPLDQEGFYEWAEDKGIEGYLFDGYDVAQTFGYAGGLQQAVLLLAKADAFGGDGPSNIKNITVKASATPGNTSGPGAGGYLTEADLGYLLIMGATNLEVLDLGAAKTNNDGDEPPTIGGELGLYDLFSNLKILKLPKGLEVLDDGAFEGLEELKELELPASLTDIGAGALNTGGTELVVTFNGDGSGLIIDEKAFGDDDSMGTKPKEINIPNGSSDNYLGTDGVLSGPLEKVGVDPEDVVEELPPVNPPSSGGCDAGFGLGLLAAGLIAAAAKGKRK